MPKPSQPLVLWFLQASRCIRTAWQLEAMELPWELRFSNRENNRAPESFKQASPFSLGKFPTLQDGDLTVFESGAIAEYLCDMYDDEGALLPKDPKARAPVLAWLHAAEATFMIHALAIMYSRWNAPKELSAEGLDQMEAALSVNVKKDLDWLEDTLAKSKSGWLVGDRLTIADIAVQFSAEIVIKRGLGSKGGKWPHVETWLSKCESTDSYRRAVEKSGHSMG